MTTLAEAKAIIAEFEPRAIPARPVWPTTGASGEAQEV